MKKQDFEGAKTFESETNRKAWNFIMRKINLNDLREFREKVKIWVNWPLFAQHQYSDFVWILNIWELFDFLP